MIDILHKRNNFNINFVKKLYYGLVRMYNIYHNIPFGFSLYNNCNDQKKLNRKIIKSNNKNIRRNIKKSRYNK